MSDEATLTDLNQQYVDAFMNANVDWYREHLTDDFVCIESNGSVLDKAKFLLQTSDGPACGHTSSRTPACASTMTSPWCTDSGPLPGWTARRVRAATPMSTRKSTANGKPFRRRLPTLDGVEESRSRAMVRRET